MNDTTPLRIMARDVLLISKLILLLLIGIAAMIGLWYAIYQSYIYLGMAEPEAGIASIITIVGIPIVYDVIAGWYDSAKERAKA